MKKRIIKNFLTAVISLSLASGSFAMLSVPASAASVSNARQAQHDAVVNTAIQYYNIITQASALDFGLENDVIRQDPDFFGPITYEYALVNMEADGVPTLLVSESNQGLSYIRFFHYDAVKGQLFYSGETSDLSAGVAPVGGYRGGLQVVPGVGLLLRWFTSYSGEGGFTLYTRDGNSLTQTELWDGMMIENDNLPDYRGVDVDWRDINDFEPLIAWLDSVQQ